MAPCCWTLGIGTLVVERLAGPLIVCSMDINRRWSHRRCGLPGTDGNRGGKHLLDSRNTLERNVTKRRLLQRTARGSNRQIDGARLNPVGERCEKLAKEQNKTIEVYPFNPARLGDRGGCGWMSPARSQDFTPVDWGDKIQPSGRLLHQRGGQKRR